MANARFHRVGNRNPFTAVLMDAKATKRPELLGVKFILIDGERCPVKVYAPSQHVPDESFYRIGRPHYWMRAKQRTP